MWKAKPKSSPTGPSLWSSPFKSDALAEVEALEGFYLLIGYMVAAAWQATDVRSALRGPGRAVTLRKERSVRVLSVEACTEAHE